MSIWVKNAVERSRNRMPWRARGGARQLLRMQYGPRSLPSTYMPCLTAPALHPLGMHCRDIRGSRARHPSAGAHLRAWVEVHEIVSRA